MPNNSHEPQLPQALYISRLDVKLSQQSRKQIKAIKLQIRNKTLKDFHAPISPSGSHSETFIPAIELQPGEPFSVSVQCRTQFRHKEVKITMDHREIVSGAQDKGGIQSTFPSYQKTEENVDVILSLHLLRPTTNDIIESCPRFRVLIIGNSGVGKSSLIKKMFGVHEVHVANAIRGIADIDREFISSQNGRFVLHDSKGFEEGDTNNVEIVKQFVKRHKDEPHIKDRLHAVWMCLEIPYSSGRLLEQGAENFLRRRHEVLGDVPLVVVLTKEDLLDNQLEIEMLEDDSDNKTFEQRKSDFLKKYCVGPLRAAAGDVPHVVVSTEIPHPTMFADVIKITKDCVNTYIGEEASMVAAMAQRASIKVNIESSIAIGRKKYWSRLAKSAFFSGRTLKECVQVLHRDIVAVWNFHDPDEVLQQDNFIGALLRMGDLEEQPPASPPMDVSPVLGLVKAIIGSAPDPALVILFSVVDAAIWLAQLAHASYQRTSKVVKLFMLYIVGSMFVMQIIFLLAPEGHVTPEVVEHAIYTYMLSKKQRVRELVDGFDVERGLLPGGPDYVLRQVEALIESCSIDDDQVEELRESMHRQLEKEKMAQ